MLLMFIELFKIAILSIYNVGYYYINVETSKSEVISSLRNADLKKLVYYEI